MTSKDNGDNTKKRAQKFVGQDDRRKTSNDRRAFGKSVSFPYKDSRGALVMRDRRKQPDRRLSNYEIFTAEMDAEEFQAYMDGFQWKL